MLKYIEKSTDDNVTNQDIASLQLLVNKIKNKKEVGINYMKSWEVEELIRKSAYKDGFDEGFNDGFNDGFSDGTDAINQLNILLTEAGRTEDIIKSARDKEYQKKLLKEFQL